MHHRDTTEGPSYQEVTDTPGAPCASFVADGAGAAFFQAFKPLQKLVSLLCLALSHLQTVNFQNHMSGFCLVFESHSPIQGHSFLAAQFGIRTSRAVLCPARWSPSCANTAKLTFLELFHCVAPYLPYSSPNSSTPCLPKLPSFSHQLRATVMPRVGTSFPALWSEKSPQEETQSSLWAHPGCFPIQELESRFCSACCPLSENNCFTYFVQFSSCLQQKGRSSYSIIIRNGNLFYLL